VASWDLGDDGREGRVRKDPREEEEEYEDDDESVGRGVICQSATGGRGKAVGGIDDVLKVLKRFSLDARGGERNCTPGT